ncbi:MAG TPA: hypothetical protein VN285_06285 [Candidatus Deferrimicrobium sp.]|nr:hypothetical protein [Candidatus Deferrimicrobium sp.]
MRLARIAGAAIAVLALLGSIAWAGSVGLKISGPGAVNDSTIKAGEKVSVDIYISSDTMFTGFSLGFKVLSPTIKNIIHVADSGKGLNKGGDVKGYNGWQDRSVWDMGLWPVERSWDGVLPDTLAFGGVSIKNRFNPQPPTKVLSFEMIVPETGQLKVDSSFFPPGGRWLFSAQPGPQVEPKWLGPYTFNVVK